jgi:cysteine desulfurase/selenocysteine lyase
MQGISMLDLQKIRTATPAYTNGIYLNSAAASLMPQSVIDAVRNHLHLESMQGGYGAAGKVADQLQDIYMAAAQLLGCDPDEIAMTDGNSRGWCNAVGAMNFRAGDRILVSRSEWGGNYAALLHIARACGAVVEVIPSDDNGMLSVNQLHAMLDERVRLIAMTWLPANGGLINPAAEVGALANATGITFSLDAAQAVGQMAVDVRQIACDILTAPGRKWLRGPRGTGLLYIRRELIEKLTPRHIDHFSAPWSDNHYALRKDARRFETAEASIALRLGLGTAIREALALGLEAIEQQITSFAEDLRAALKTIEGVTILDLGIKHSGLVSFSLDGITAAKLRQLLQTEGLEVALSGIAFTPLDMTARGLTDVVRASPHLYTTPDDLSRLVSAVEKISRSL